MPTPDLFEFDVNRLADYDPERVRQALRQRPAIYVNHLQIAQWCNAGPKDSTTAQRAASTTTPRPLA